MCLIIKMSKGVPITNISFHVGTKVIIQGLASATKYNGCNGTIIGPPIDDDGKRYPVRVLVKKKKKKKNKSKTLQVRAANLSLPPKAANRWGGCKSLEQLLEEDDAEGEARRIQKVAATLKDQDREKLESASVDVDAVTSEVNAALRRIRANSKAYSELMKKLDAAEAMQRDSKTKAGARMAHRRRSALIKQMEALLDDSRALIEKHPVCANESGVRKMNAALHELVDDK